jgi:hypothetical protein
MEKTNLEDITVFRIGGDPYTREDLMKMDPVCLRALYRERIHHTIEVEIYPGYCSVHCHQGSPRGQDGLERYPDADGLLCPDCDLL